MTQRWTTRWLVAYRRVQGGYEVEIRRDGVTVAAAWTAGTKRDARETVRELVEDLERARAA